MGRLKAVWNGRSFCIIRDTPSKLKVIVDEKFTATDFSFAIILQSSRNEQKTVIVQQKGSQGYTFDKIEYALPKDALGGIFNTEMLTIHSENSGKYTLSPYTYIDTRILSYFRSPERGAFPWMDYKVIEVKVPSEVRNNVIYYDEIKHPYSTVSYLKPGNLDENTTVIIDVPNGKSEFYLKFKVLNRDFPYTLTLMNNRTGAKKKIKGTWTESSFPGDYEIVWVR